MSQRSDYVHIGHVTSVLYLHRTYFNLEFVRADVVPVLFQSLEQEEWVHLSHCSWKVLLSETALPLPPCWERDSHALLSGPWPILWRHSKPQLVLEAAHAALSSLLFCSPRQQ